MKLSKATRSVPLLALITEKAQLLTPAVGPEHHQTACGWGCLARGAALRQVTLYSIVHSAHKTQGRRRRQATKDMKD